MSTNLKVERILRLLYIPARLSFVLLLYVLSRRTSRILYVKEEMKSPLTWRKLKGVPLLKAVNLLTSTFLKLFSKQLSMISSAAGFYWYINRKYAIAIRNVYDVSLSNDISFENYQ